MIKPFTMRWCNPCALFWVTMGAAWAPWYFGRFSLWDVLLLAGFITFGFLVYALESGHELRGWVDDLIADVWFAFRPKRRGAERLLVAASRTIFRSLFLRK